MGLHGSDVTLDLTAVLLSSSSTSAADADGELAQG